MANVNWAKRGFTPDFYCEIWSDILEEVSHVIQLRLVAIIWLV